MGHSNMTFSVITAYHTSRSRISSYSTAKCPTYVYIIYIYVKDSAPLYNPYLLRRMHDYQKTAHSRKGESFDDILKTNGYISVIKLLFNSRF